MNGLPELGRAGTQRALVAGPGLARHRERQLLQALSPADRRRLNDLLRTLVLTVEHAADGAH